MPCINDNMSVKQSNNNNNDDDDDDVIQSCFDNEGRMGYS